MNIKLSRVSFFLFLFSFNYLWLRVIIFNYFYNDYGNMSWIYALALMLIVLIVLLLIPKKLFNIDYESKYTKSKIKYFINFILAAESFLGITISCYLLRMLFISDLKLLSLIIGISITIGIISINKASDIIQMSTIFLIVGLGLMIFSYFFYIDLDTSLLLPMNIKNIVLVPLLSLMIIGNNASILLMDKNNFKLTKTIFILPIISAIVFLIWEMLLLILSSGTEIFKDLLWVGFISASVKPVAKYVGNFDFAYIIYILLCCVFKYAYNFSVIRNSFRKNTSKISVLYSLIIIIGAGSIYFFVPFSNIFILISAGVIILELLVLIWCFKEYYYVRKIKE